MEKSSQAFFLNSFFSLSWNSIIWITFNPVPNDKLCTSKLKNFADDNFEFDENGRKFSEQLENIVGKGEIACYEQFLIFSQCFQKTSTADT